MKLPTAMSVEEATFWGYFINSVPLFLLHSNPRHKLKKVAITYQLVHVYLTLSRQTYELHVQSS